jgi:hypothetical protein
MAAKNSENRDRRIRERKPLELRVDVKILPKKEVEGILDGEGYADLSASAPSMRRPRVGMETGGKTLDVSYSGMGLRCSKLYEKGTATALDLHIPGQRIVVKLLGEIMWAGEVEGEPRAGIRFAALDLHSALRLDGYLSRQS